jgi:trans-aconitate methyltransferase
MDAGNLALDALARGLQSAGGDVDRLVEQRFPGARIGGLEQQARLVGRAGAQLGDAQAGRLLTAVGSAAAWAMIPPALAANIARSVRVR